MFRTIVRFFRRLFDYGQEISNGETETQREMRSDNLPEETTLPLPAPPKPSEEETPTGMLLWYPNRVKTPEAEKYKQTTRGYYQKGHPEGAIIHYTSGRSRPAELGGSKNAKTAYEMGIRTLSSSVKDAYTYFIIDADGNVFQSFPLDRWGYHAGKSKCPKTGRSDVSKYYVGIEVMCAGKVTRIADDTFHAWFTNTGRGDLPFKMSTGEVQYFPAKANIQQGYYHVYTDKQRVALVDLLIWLKRNSPDFQLDQVFGHDEIAPNRKDDPGGSLRMTMPEFRSMLKDIIKIEKPNSSLLNKLVKTYKTKHIQYENLKLVTLAQWLLESGRAESELATKYFNFAGLKFRPEMAEIGAIPVSYKAHDGVENYCKFRDINHFIDGYWAFLERPTYKGWHNVANDPEKFLRFIVNAGYCPDNGYVDKVLSLIPEVRTLMADS